VSSRWDKRRAEDLVDDISGVRHVQNNLRIGTGTNDTLTGSTTV
jgi:osmotically-inducible protein OsmY